MPPQPPLVTPLVLLPSQTLVPCYMLQETKLQQTNNTYVYCISAIHMYIYIYIYIYLSVHVYDVHVYPSVCMCILCMCTNVSMSRNYVCVHMCA